MDVSAPSQAYLTQGERELGPLLSKSDWHFRHIQRRLQYFQQEFDFVLRYTIVCPQKQFRTPCTRKISVFLRMKLR